MKKLQTLTTTAVIGLASASMPAFAQEANSDVDTTTSVNEPALVSKPVADASPITAVVVKVCNFFINFSFNHLLSDFL